MYLLMEHFYLAVVRMMMAFVILRAAAAVHMVPLGASYQRLIHAG
jgi:hypothetical protein